jgi:hypothetical protein
MRKAITVVGIFVLAAIAIAWSKSGPQLTSKTDVTAISPYEIMLQQGDNLPSHYWEEPF